MKGCVERQSLLIIDQINLWIITGNSSEWENKWFFWPSSHDCFVKGVRNTVFVDLADSEFRTNQNFPPAFMQRTSLSKLRLGFSISGRGQTTPCNSMLDIEKALFTRHITITKPTVSKSSVTDIDTPGNTVTRLIFTNTKALAVSWEGAGYFPPSPSFFLNGSDCLARSQNHLWLRVHLFRITIPGLDLWRSLSHRSHFSRNDNEFEDKSWKSILLWQLRFPWLIDKDNNVGAIEFGFFPQAKGWGCKIYWMWLLLRDKDKKK